MATLFTVDRIQYFFDPAGIVAVSDRDPATGKSVTCVYGLNMNYLNIDEKAGEFLARLAIAEKFGQLTRTDDSFVWINKSSILSLRARIWSDAPAANSVVIISAIMPITQWVKQTVEEAAAILGVSGAQQQV